MTARQLIAEIRKAIRENPELADRPIRIQDGTFYEDDNADFYAEALNAEPLADGVGTEYIIIKSGN